MPISEWLFPSGPCKRYDTPERLFAGLKALDSGAILCVQLKVLPMTRKFVRRYGLSMDQADEIINKGTLIFLQKIEQGTYQFQGHAPSSYLIEIIRNLCLMATRSKKTPLETIDSQLDRADPDLELFEKRRDATELVRQLLERIGPPCEQVIRLHHIDGYSDEEIVSRGLTKYTTTDSLKMKRSDCMKKLTQMAKQWKILNNT